MIVLSVVKAAWSGVSDTGNTQRRCHQCTGMRRIEDGLSCAWPFLPERDRLRLHNLLNPITVLASYALLGRHTWIPDDVIMNGEAGSADQVVVRAKQCGTRSAGAPDSLTDSQRPKKSTGA